MNNYYSTIPLCPICFKKIPILNILYNIPPYGLKVRTLCTCTKDSSFILPIQEYFNLMIQKNKNVIENCSYSKHSEINASKYCSICKKWYCDLCLDIHKNICNGNNLNHFLSKFNLEFDSDSFLDKKSKLNDNDLEYIKNSYNKVKNIFFNKCKIIKNNFLKILNEKIIFLQNLIKEIEKNYKYNEEYNLLICKLIDNIIYNYLTTKENPIKNLKINLENFTKFNYNEVNISNNNIIIETNKFIDFLKNNYILKFEEFKKIQTLQIPDICNAICEVGKNKIIFAIGKFLHIYNEVNGKVLNYNSKIEAHNNNIILLDYSEKFNIFCSGDKNKIIKIWNNNNNENISNLICPDEFISLKFLKNTNSIFTASKNSNIYIFDIKNKQIINYIKCNYNELIDIIQLNSNNNIVCLSNDKQIKVLEPIYFKFILNKNIFLKNLNFFNKIKSVKLLELIDYNILIKFENGLILILDYINFNEIKRFDCSKFSNFLCQLNNGILLEASNSENNIEINHSLVQWSHNYQVCLYTDSEPTILYKSKNEYIYIGLNNNSIIIESLKN